MQLDIVYDEFILMHIRCSA